MKKKHALITCAIVVCALLIAAVCLLPWRTRVNVTMYGAEVNKDGEILNTVEFTVSGWKLNYLFRDDDLRLNIVFSDGKTAPFRSAETNSLNVQAGSLVSVYHTTSPAFWENGFGTGLIVFSTGFQRCAMGLSTYVGETAVGGQTCIVASTDRDFDAAKLLESFSSFALTK